MNVTGSTLINYSTGIYALVLLFLITIALRWGFFSRSEDPEKACEIHHSDTLFVTMHSGDMQKALEKFTNDFEYIAFQRDFKGSPRVRVYNIQQFKSKLK
jgi:hypothetical protein